MNQMMKSALKKVAVAGVGVGAVIGGTMAYALWTANGSGSGNAKALSAQSITVTAATGAADLYPGFTQGDVFFTVSNTNPYPVTFTGMTAGTVVSGDPTNCPASNVTVSSATVSIAVPAGATNASKSIADVVTMISGAPDGCQGVTFTIPLTLTGSQS
jgi:hypothetical protein